METSEHSDENIVTEPKVDCENKNRDANTDAMSSDEKEYVMNSESNSTGQEIDEKPILKRKADDDTSDQVEKVAKIDIVDNSESVIILKEGKSKEDSNPEPMPEPIREENDDFIAEQSTDDSKVLDTSQIKSTETTPKSKTLKSPQTSPMEATRQSVRSNRNSNPAAFLLKKSKIPTDMSNPAFKKPFKYGWRRELVYRANSESGTKRNGDIYYFTPDGKKVRSMREVLENLKNRELSTDNFTFYKEPVGMNNPELEIIRVAKVKGSAGPTGGFTVAKKPTKKELKSLERSILANKVNKPQKFTNGLKIKLSGARLGQNKRSISSLKADKKRKSSKTSLQMGMLPPGWPSQKKTENLLSGVSDKLKQLTEQCSIRCNGVDPVVPTLQCSICLCLYHPECVGFDQMNEAQENYICKNCQPQPEKQFQTNGTAQSPEALPTLTPFNALKTHAPISLVPPRLHRISSTEGVPVAGMRIEQSPAKKINRHSKLLNPRPIKSNESHHINSNISENKSLVGSVTTWVHPSSTVQMMQSNNESIASLSDPSEPSQSQAIIGGRKYIIIPKQNVLSILPNEQTNIIPPSENAQTPSTSNNFDTAEPIASATDKVPDTASLGPLTYNSEIITVTTNNAANFNSNTADMECSNFEDDQTRLGHGSKDVKIISTPEKVSARGKRNSHRSSTTSTTSERVKQNTIEKDNYMHNFFMHVSVGYTALLQVFQYLKVQELLRATRVCRLWRDLASHPSLWRIVRMKNSQVRDWKGLIASLKHHNTETLDLRKMLISGKADDMWSEFSKELGNANTLTRIDLCRCPASVVEQLALTNSNLEIINAISIRCTSIDLSCYDKLKNLRELRLKSQSGIELKLDFLFLENLQQLRHLSLLSFKDLGKKQIEIIGKLIKLESLELGECDSLEENFGLDILTKLSKLIKLRLEKGPSAKAFHNILSGISKLPLLEQIELVNFDVKSGFDEALALCKNIKRLLLIPTYISQSATTNNMVLNGIFHLKDNLTHFVWGVTLELLRVTELFIDQCDQTSKKKAQKKDKKGSGSANASIPILKPVPFLEDVIGSSKPEDNTQVEILAVQSLQNFLSNKLENTKVKILKIPYHATWRQSMNDALL